MPMTTLERRRRERLRATFQPARLRLLFIGESAPASGRFFYQRDSGLYRAMRDALRTVDPSIDDANFLAVFQAAGCYLIDLCPEPVDDLDARLRQAACRAAEGPLSRTIARLQPPMIATLLRSIEDNVVRSAARADWHGPLLRLPYPGRWSRFRDQFVRDLAPVLRGLMAEGTSSHLDASQARNSPSGATSSQ
jgi:hypothetical protein